MSPDEEATALDADPAASSDPEHPATAPGYEDEPFSTYGEIWGVLHYLYLPLVLGVVILSSYLWYDMFLRGGFEPRLTFALVFWPILAFFMGITSFITFQTARRGVRGDDLADTQSFHFMLFFHGAVFLFAVFAHQFFWGLILLELPYLFTGLIEYG